MLLTNCKCWLELASRELKTHNGFYTKVNKNPKIKETSFLFLYAYQMLNCYTDCYTPILICIIINPRCYCVLTFNVKFFYSDAKFTSTK